MPTHTFALEPGGSKRLEITFGPSFEDARVLLDGREIGAFADRSAFEEGATYTLPDGSQLSVRLADGPELDVRRDGVPVEPPRRRSVATIVYLIGALYVLSGIGALAGVEFLAAVGYGWSTILFGAVFLVLARFVQKRSTAALVIAIVLFVLESVTSALVISSVSGRVPIGLLIVRLLLVLQMAVGLAVMRSAPLETGRSS